MSFSNSTARTRGGSAATAVPVSARAAERAQRSAKKPRKSSIFECKNSIRVKLSLLRAEKAFVCLPRRSPSSDDPVSRRPRVRDRSGRSRGRPRSGPVRRRDEPVSATGQLRARQAPLEFNLIGLHWKGPGSVSFRTFSQAGRWSSWREAAAEAEDSPDAGSAEDAAARGWTLGSPYWTGPATSIQYRLGGRVSKLRAYFLRSDPHAEKALLAGRGAARASQPRIIRRAT